MDKKGQLPGSVTEWILTFLAFMAIASIFAIPSAGFKLPLLSCLLFISPIVAWAIWDDYQAGKIRVECKGGGC